MDSNTVLPLLEQPIDFEAEAYYWAFPSRPRLLGRTSSGTTPWWRLSEPETNDTVFFGRTAGLENATVYGPVGTHAIHACWESSTLGKVRAVLGRLPWTSIDVLRIGRTILQERERPVIVWVGISRARLADITEPLWPIIASTLRAVRQVLDEDGLFDVECELRQSDVFKTAGTVPRLLEPPKGDEVKNVTHNQRVIGQAISTAVGLSISPGHHESAVGTLGLYLEAVSEPGNARKDDGTKWALTCHHVAFPVQDDRTKPPTDILLPATPALDNAFFRIGKDINRVQREVDAGNNRRVNTPDQARHLEDEKRELNIGMRLRDKLRAFKESDQARTLGTVHYSPPISVHNVKDQPQYTIDWALIKLNRAKFPLNFSLENVLHQRPRPEYVYPPNKLLRLQGIVPLAEMRGRPPSHNMVANRDGDPHLIVMKRGFKTSLTVGVVLDIKSLTRQFPGGREDVSTEVTVVHITGKRQVDDDTPAFSKRGDSGAVVFDLKGRIVGMMTSGAGAVGRVDTTYVTAFDYLKQSIEQELKRPVRIC